MKVAELEGTLLNYWVAKAEGIKYWIERSSIDWDVCADTGNDRSDSYAPSTDWAIGGPIIEKAAIGWNSKNAFSSYSGSHKGLSSFDGQPWEAWFCDEGPDGGNVVHEQVKVGRTMLEACMRAYVASKFGPEVPDTAPA